MISRLLLCLTYCINATQNNNIDYKEYENQAHKGYVETVYEKAAQANRKTHVQDAKIDALKDSIRLMISHNNYKRAAEISVQLWHITNDFSDLTKAVDLYMSINKYRELRQLLNNIMELKGIEYHNYELVLLVAQAYYQQGVEEDDIKALHKAMEHISAYEEHANISVSYREYINNARADITNRLAVSELKALLYAAKHEKQTGIWIMRECLEFMKKYPHTPYTSEAKKLYMTFYEAMRLKQISNSTFNQNKNSKN